MSNRYLIDHYEQSSENEKREGLVWYKEAHDYCADLASLTGIELKVSAAVVSVLSPRNKWPRNKQDAKSLIEAHQAGRPMDSFSVCTFTGNKRRAWELISDPSGFDPDKFFKGLKTRCFWDNIVFPDSQRVTIDTWAARAAYNTKGNWQRSLKATEYRQLEKQYQTAAKEVDLTPKDFQAVVWVRLRNVILNKANA
jgi:hypothetical protein